MNREYATSNLVDELLKQKDAHDSIVSALKQRIEDIEKECDNKSNELLVQFLFFTDKHPELIPEFVKLAYEYNTESAKYSVASFHEETLDLSTLKCTGNDFMTWCT